MYDLALPSLPPQQGKKLLHNMMHTEVTSVALLELLRKVQCVDFTSVCEGHDAGRMHGRLRVPCSWGNDLCTAFDSIALAIFISERIDLMFVSFPLSCSCLQKLVEFVRTNAKKGFKRQTQST